MYRIKVGYNFKLSLLEELGAVLFVKLNSIFLQQLLYASAFAPYASRGQFHQQFMCSFYAHKSQQLKKESQIK